MSTTACTDDYGTCPVDGSVLDNIAADAHTQTERALREQLVQATIGDMIPEQFGYRVEISPDQGQTWDVIYETTAPGDPHADTAKKLTISSQVISFGYSGQVKKFKESPYNYLTCTGDGYGDGDTDAFDDWGLITCAVIPISGKEKPMTNQHPGTVLRGDLVPSSNVKVVRFTVYI